MNSFLSYNSQPNLPRRHRIVGQHPDEGTRGPEEGIVEPTLPLSIHPDNQYNPEGLIDFFRLGNALDAGRLLGRFGWDLDWP